MDHFKLRVEIPGLRRCLSILTVTGKSKSLSQSSIINRKFPCATRSRASNPPSLSLVETNAECRRPGPCGRDCGTQRAWNTKKSVELVVKLDVKYANCANCAQAASNTSTTSTTANWRNWQYLISNYLSSEFQLADIFLMYILAHIVRLKLLNYLFNSI